MDLAELRRLVETADWFGNLGRAAARPGVVPVTDVEQWRGFTAALTNADFGLRCDEDVLQAHPFRDMEWLPTTNDQEDPIHGGRLLTLVRAQGREPEFRAARLDVLRLAQQSLRGAPEQPLLKVGATDYHPAARGAALFACRMAASEIVAAEPGLWCEVLRLYHQGHWPMGIAPSRALVVL